MNNYIVEIEGIKTTVITAKNPKEAVLETLKKNDKQCLSIYTEIDNTYNAKVKRCGTKSNYLRLNYFKVVYADIENKEKSTGLTPQDCLDFVADRRSIMIKNMLEYKTFINMLAKHNFLDLMPVLAQNTIQFFLDKHKYVFFRFTENGVQYTNSKTEAISWHNKEPIVVKN